MARSGRTVHIVDDEPSVLRALTRLIGMWGYQVKTYASARDFLAANASGGCLLLDIRMPVMDGFELLDALKARGVSLPVVLMTAFDNPGDRERADRCGVVAFLLKPIGEDDLRKNLETAYGSTAG